MLRRPEQARVVGVGVEDLVLNQRAGHLQGIAADLDRLFQQFLPFQGQAELQRRARPVSHKTNLYLTRPESTPG